MADVLQLSGIRHVVAGFVLGQDLHQRAELQPPLLFGDPVPGDGGASSDLCGRLIRNFPYLHKVGLALQLHDGLEDQSPAAHSQQAAGVLAVRKHSSCRGNNNGVSRRDTRGGTEKYPPPPRQMVVAGDGGSSSGWNLEECVKINGAWGSRGGRGRARRRGQRENTRGGCKANGLMSTCSFVGQ